MTTARYHIKDTNLDTWQVSPSDPAHPAIDKLKKLGYDPETIQLPIEVIVCGEATLQHLEESENTYTNVLNMYVSISSIQPDEPPDDDMDKLILQLYANFTQLEAIIHASD